MTLWRERRLLPGDGAEIEERESGGAGTKKNGQDVVLFYVCVRLACPSTRQRLTSDAIFRKESCLTALSDGSCGEWLRRDSAETRRSQWRHREPSARIARGELWVYFRV